MFVLLSQKKFSAINLTFLPIDECLDMVSVPAMSYDQCGISMGGEGGNFL